MGYPKAMYRGSFTPEAIQAEEKTVRDEQEERAVRKHGFVDGHEFFSKTPSSPKKAVRGTV